MRARAAKPNPFLRPGPAGVAPSGVVAPDNARTAVLAALAKGHKTAEEITAGRSFSVALIKRNLKRLDVEGLVKVVGHTYVKTKSGDRKRRVWGLA